MTMLPDDSDSTQGLTTVDDSETEFQTFLDSLGGSFEYRGNDTIVREDDNVIAPLEDDGEVSDTTPVSGEDTETTGEITPGDNPPAPPVTPTDTVRIGEQDVPLDEVTTLYELGRTIRESGLQPTAPLVTEGESVPPPTVETPPTPPTIPDYIDVDDPVQMGLWNELQSVKEQVAATTTTVKQSAEESARVQAEATLERALSAYRTKYPSVTDTDLALIRPQAALIVNPMIQQHGPVDGMVRALYVASLENDTTRNKVLGIDTTSPEVKSETRKRKLSALSGTSGSAPKTSPSRPQYTSDRDVVNALAKELSDSTAFNGRIN